SPVHGCTARLHGSRGGRMTEREQELMRADLLLIQDWIAPGSRVLDLGCGDGSFLAHLKQTRNIRDCGLERDANYIRQCLEAGVNVIEQDMDKGLENFETGSFDTVV